MALLNVRQAALSTLIALLSTAALMLAVTSSGDVQAQSQIELDKQTYRQIAEGLFARERVSPKLADGVVFRVWDLHLGPGVRSSGIRFPGGVVIELRQGSGTIVLSNDREIRQEPGDFVSIDEREDVVFDNSKSDRPMLMRATIISLADE